MRGDYVLSSDCGDDLIRIPESTSVNDLRYMIDNIDRLKTLVQNAMVKGLRKCGGCCGVWGHEHDSGSGMGYNCNPLKNTLPDFTYWNMFDWHHICADKYEVGKPDKCKINIPSAEERDPKYVGRLWLNDWTNFEDWLQGAIGSHDIEFSGDINKLTSSEELELHRLLNKMHGE